MFYLLRGIARSEGVAVVCSLHQVHLARAYADRIVGLSSGRVVFDLPAARFRSSGPRRACARRRMRGARCLLDEVDAGRRCETRAVLHRRIAGGNPAKCPKWTRKNEVHRKQKAPPKRGQFSALVRKKPIQGDSITRSEAKCRRQGGKARGKPVEFEISAALPPRSARRPLGASWGPLAAPSEAQTSPSAAP